MFEPNCVIAIISPEVSLKSKKVRKQIESILKQTIINNLEKNLVKYSVVSISAGRIFVFTKEVKKTIKILEKIFGIYYLFPAQEEKITGFENICNFALNISKKNIFGDFAIRCKSFLKEKNSKDFEIEIGSKILSNIKDTKVNLSKPMTQLNLIVFENKAFFYFDCFEGAKGMPVLSQGNVVLVSFSKKNSEKLALQLFKSGCNVFSIGKKIVLKDYFLETKKISIEQAKKFYENNSVAAFFTDAKSIREKKIVEKEFGVKIFAPFLF